MDGPTRPSSRWAGLVTLVVGVSGVLVGYLLGVSGEVSTDSLTPGPSTVTGAPLSEPTSSTAPTLPVPGGTLITTTAPARLFDLVPPMQGRRLVAVGPRDALIWRAGGRTPASIPLPVNSWSAWHDTGRHLAYLKYETAAEASQGNELFLAFEAGTPQPIAIGAISFAWHPTKDRIAWLGPALPSQNLFAYAGTVDYFGVSDITLVDLGFTVDDPFTVRLVGFSDAGWAVQHGESVITVSADGLDIARRDGIAARTMSPDGLLLIGDLSDGPLAWTDFGLESESLASVDAGYIGFEWAPAAGTFVAHRRGAGGGTGLFMMGIKDEPLAVPLPVQGLDPAITPNGELVVVVAHRDEFGTTIVLYEMETSRQWVVELPGTYRSADVGEG
jgi:hypothetical protein